VHPNLTDGVRHHVISWHKYISTVIIWSFVLSDHGWQLAPVCQETVHLLQVVDVSLSGHEARMHISKSIILEVLPTKCEFSEKPNVFLNASVNRLKWEQWKTSLNACYHIHGCRYRDPLVRLLGEGWVGNCCRGGIVVACYDLPPPSLPLARSRSSSAHWIDFHRRQLGWLMSCQVGRGGQSL